MGKTPDTDVLKGTTLKVYRFLFKSGRPASIRDVQRGLNLSSPSVAEYHLKKLLSSGLVNQVAEGYVTNDVVWQNMIRFKRKVIPFQAVYSVFFGLALAVMLGFAELPSQGYLFGLAIVGTGFCISVYETLKALQRSV